MFFGHHNANVRITTSQYKSSRNRHVQILKYLNVCALYNSNNPPSAPTAISAQVWKISYVHLSPFTISSCTRKSLAVQARHGPFFYYRSRTVEPCENIFTGRKEEVKARQTRGLARNDGPIFVISVHAVNFRRRESGSRVITLRSVLTFVVSPNRSAFGRFQRTVILPLPHSCAHLRPFRILKFREYGKQHCLTIITFLSLFQVRHARLSGCSPVDLFG